MAQPRLSLGSRIKSFRLSLNLTQLELGRRAEVKNVTICRIERGQVEYPRLETLTKLAKALRVPVKMLL